MFKKNLIVILFSILSIILLTFNNVAALSCAEPLSIEENLKKYEGIIVGEVLSIKENKNSKLLTVNIEENLKGIEEKKLIIQEDKTWGESIEGKSYLFYLNKNNLNQWEHPLCSPSSELETEIEKVKEFILNNESNLKQNMQEPEYNEKINISNELDEKTKNEDIKNENKSSVKKETIILSIIFLTFSIFVFIFLKNQKKDN